MHAEGPIIQQHLPVVFEPNRGQAPASVRWLAQGNGYRFLFTDDGVTIMLARPPVAARHGTSARSGTLHLTFKGGRLWDHISGLEPTGGASNYVRRSTALDSITGVPHYARLRVAQVYPGVDVDFYNDNGNLEYDFILRPGADPNQIHVALDGQQELRVDSHSGDLIAVMPMGGELHHVRPKVYQQAGDRHVEISANYALMRPNVATFTLGAYDATKELTIDSTIQAWQFLGQSAIGLAIAIDGDGNAYVAGNTSDGFPVTNRANPYDDGESHNSILESIWNFFADFPNYGFRAAPATEPDCS